MNRKGERVRSSAAFDEMTDRPQNWDAQALSQMDSLKVSEENLRRLTDNMYDVITQIGPGGAIQYASPSYRWVLGIEPQEVIGQIIFERLHPDDLEDAQAVFSLAVESRKRPGPVVFRYLHAEGHYLWMECVCHILKDEHNEFAGAVLSSRDISERKRMESELRESERRYRLLAENASDVIWVRNLDLELTYISPAVEKLLGFSVQEALGQSIAEILTPDSAQFFNEFYKDILSMAESVPPGQIKDEHLKLELEMVCKDGSKVWTETRMSLLLDEHGKPRGILGVTRDIAERKRAENELNQLNAELEKRVQERTAELTDEIAERKRVEVALRESEERYSLAVRGANDGLWDWNLKSGEIYFSPRWNSMLGFDESEARSSPEEWFKRVHPQDLPKLQAAISLHLNGDTTYFECEYRIRHANEDYMWMLCRGLAVRYADGRAYRMAGSQTDITDRKWVEERLAHDALHDSLTGLPNRVLFVDRLRQRLEYAKRHPDDLFAVLFMDLDRFKVINDSLGHSVGDTFLASVAQHLRSILRPDDTVSRLGGDEFAVLLNGVNDVSDTVRVAERILAQLKSTDMLRSVNRSSTASIGIALYKGNYTEPQELLRDADSAMYRAKASGGGRYQIFDSTMYENAVALMQIEADLKLAVENQEWQVYYQPIISLESGEVSGVEALLRWIHPKRGMILPLDFIHVAEETGLIMQIGAYVLREACAQAKTWRDSHHPKLWVSVNISGCQFQNKNLTREVEGTLRETGLAGDGLRLEITESVAMKDLTHSINVLNELNKLGVSISLDDFGNGYSSLSYLKQFPLKVLKIDRSFIQDNDSNKNGEAITSAIIFMGQTLSLEVVAEGVETQEQLKFLKSQFCDEAQGFLFGRPMPAEEFGKLLHKKRNFLEF
jgi:diguanylate cyclase (GGDEF)-like protein/PAS domain S-box-containing protein